MGLQDDIDRIEESVSRLRIVYRMASGNKPFRNGRTAPEYTDWLEYRLANKGVNVHHAAIALEARVERLEAQANAQSTDKTTPANEYKVISIELMAPKAGHNDALFALTADGKVLLGTSMEDGVHWTDCSPKTLIKGES